MRILFSLLLASALGGQALAQSPMADTRLVSDQLHLLGVWTSNCYNPSQITASGQNIFVKDIYSFGATGNYTLESNHFSDAACTIAQGNSENFFGDYRLGENVEDIDGHSLRRILLTLDNMDWPAQLPAANLQWVVGFDKDRLFFGAYNPPFNMLTPGVWFEKNLAPNNGVFVF